jgi:hypothetical protein
MNGPQLIFQGQGAGLKRKLGGDMNSPFDYTLLCAGECKTPEGNRTELGPLGRFLPNEHGTRTAYCPNCKHVIIIGKAGQVEHYMPFTSLQGMKVGT